MPPAPTNRSRQAQRRRNREETLAEGAVGGGDAAAWKTAKAGGGEAVDVAGCRALDAPQLQIAVHVGWGSWSGCIGGSAVGSEFLIFSCLSISQFSVSPVGGPLQHAQSWQNAAEWNIPHSRTTVKLFCSGTPLFLSSMDRVAGADVPALNIDRQAAVAPNTCGATAATRRSE